MSELIQDMRTWRFWRHYGTKSLAILGSMVAFIRIILLFFPCAKFILGWVLFFTLVVTALIVAIYLCWPRPIEAVYSSPSTKIKIVKGDFFKQKTNLIVGICNTFDNETPDVVAKSSLLGQTIENLYGGAWKDLDRDLFNALVGKQVVEPIEKEGKKEKYAIGTVVTVKNGGKKLFFSAYCDIDADNKASSDVESVMKSLSMLWVEVSSKGNGEAVSITPWGGGLSRLSNILPAQDAIRLITLSFMFASRKQKVCDELRVIVQDDVFKKLDRLELQAFLSSLRGS
jgi:hypothetical protein